MARNNRIAVVDLGTSKVVCLIARSDAEHGVVIEGIGHQLSEGVKAGMIVDVRKAENSLINAVHSAEKMAGQNIDAIYVNLSGGSLRTQNVMVETRLSGAEITEGDINRMLKQGKQHAAKDGYQILHTLPSHYQVDDLTGILDPRGMVGEKLRTELFVMQASESQVKNTTNCVSRCRLHVDGLIASGLAATRACITDDEAQLGSLLIDLGAGQACISVMHEGDLIYNSSIPLGGNHITRDIAMGLSASQPFAERIKVLYGSCITGHAIGSSDMIDVASNSLQDLSESEYFEHDYISKSQLASIIRPRVEEIMEMIRDKVQREALPIASISRVVLTGGSSQLSGIKELTRHVFGKNVRLATPAALEGLADAMQGAAFATVVGMVVHAKENLSQGDVAIRHEKASKSSFSSVRKWIKNNL